MSTMSKRGAYLLHEEGAVVDRVVEDLLGNVALLEDGETEDGPRPHRSEGVEFGVWHPCPQQGQSLRHFADVGLKVQLDLQRYQPHPVMRQPHNTGAASFQGSTLEVIQSLSFPDN